MAIIYQPMPEVQCASEHCNANTIIDQSHRPEYAVYLVNQWLSEHTRDTGHHNYRVVDSKDFVVINGIVPVLTAKGGKD